MYASSLATGGLEVFTVGRYQIQCWNMFEKFKSCKTFEIISIWENSTKNLHYFECRVIWYKIDNTGPVCGKDKEAGYISKVTPKYEGWRPELVKASASWGSEKQEVGPAPHRGEVSHYCEQFRKN